MEFITFVLILACQGYYVNSVKNEEIDPLKTIVWGPGLKPAEITMGARYFFLQLVNSIGKNLTESPGQDIITAYIRGLPSTGKQCHVSIHVLDCKDGSFIVRYKVHNVCFNLNIDVSVKNHHLPQATLSFPGPVYAEECNCPQSSLLTWMKNYGCTEQNYTQMMQDLASFKSVNFDTIRESLIQNYDRPNSISICHYILKDNRIFRRCYGQHVGFKIFMDKTLQSLARKVLLPDIEFFVNLGDWPLALKTGPNYPIFSWCGSTETRDIVMPTYDLTESSMGAMGRVMLDMLAVQGNTKVSWAEKEQKLFWRGRDSSRERLDLIDISRKHPELFNASITNFFFFKNEMDKYGPGQKPISFFEFFRYKYQMNVDGSVAAYRLPYLLAGDSLVLKQDSKYYEYFYGDLVPNVHYVPVKKDLSNLVEKVKWAIKHDNDALKITKAARQFARDHLMPQNIFCYHVLLFHEWSKRLINKVKVLDGMEEVPQPEHSCNCYETYPHSGSKIVSSKDEL